MRIIKEGAIYFGATVFEGVVPFLLMPLLTRLLTTEEYGVIAIFLTMVSIYGLIIGIGLGAFLKVIYHKSESIDFKEYVGNVLTLSIATLLLTIVLTTIFENSVVGISGLGNNLISFVIVVASAQYIISLRLIIYQTMRMPLQYGKLQLTRPVVDIVLVMLLVVYLSGGGEERIHALILSAVFAGAIACISLYRDGLLGLSFNKTHALRAIRFVLPLLPHTIALTLVFTVDKLILSSGIGFQIVGELAVAVSLASPMMIISESINRAFMPWSLGRFRLGQLGHVVGASYILMISMFCACLAYSFVLFMLFEIIVGSDFHNALIPAMILIWSGWFKLGYYLAIKGVIYCEKTSYISVTSVFAGMAYIIAILLNLENLVLEDIAVYMIIYYGIMFIGAFVISQIIFPQPWRNISSMIEVGRMFFRPNMMRG